MQKGVNIKLNVEVNKVFLAVSTIARWKHSNFAPYLDTQTKRQIRNFQNSAYDLSPKMSLFIDGRETVTLLVEAIEKTAMTELGKEVHDYMREVINSCEFEILYNNTIKSRERVIEEWTKNYHFCKTFVESLGIDLGDEFTVRLLHPGFRVGNSKDKIITWSEQTYWPNYNTVYLWHEVLHSYFDKSDEQHAIIELIADNEMRKRLNKIEYPPFEGHEELNELREKINPLFQNFLTQKDKDMHAFVDSIEKVIC